MLWNPELLARIDAADDLKIAPYLSSEPIVVPVQNGIRQHCLSRRVRYWLTDRNSTYCSQNHQTLSLKVKLIRLTRKSTPAAAMFPQ